MLWLRVSSGGPCKIYVTGRNVIRSMGFRLLLSVLNSGALSAVKETHFSKASPLGGRESAFSKCGSLFGRRSS